MINDITNDLPMLKVISFDPNLVQFEIVDLDAWSNNNTDGRLQIGSFVKIKDGNGRAIIACVESFKVVDKTLFTYEFDDPNRVNKPRTSILLNAQPIGQLEYDSNKSEFSNGIKNISIPPEGVELASTEDMRLIFSHSKDSSDNFSFGKHNQYSEVEVSIDGNDFFSKHIAVLGSTGSGKSCTVASILQKLKSNESSTDNLKNSHVIIFDVHGEYQSAFPKSNYLSVKNPKSTEYLSIPYWLLSSEELESLFIENSEMNAYNQISQFKTAVIENKKKFNPEQKNSLNYDTPVYFDINEVFNYIYNKNFETHYEKDGKIYYAIKGDEKIENSDNNYELLFAKREFYPTSGNAKVKELESKVESKRNGFYGQFPRFINRFESKMRDSRLQFILSNKIDDDCNSSDEFYKVVAKFLGYTDKNKKNVTIIDLSSLPFEVVSLIVSVVSRIAFDMAYYNSKNKKENETPFLLVFEEAHKYIPRNNDAKFRDTRIAVERIAKEGRKYGISEMIVSQRPSELSATVLSQCNNFVVMKLTNSDDQSIVRSVLPDTVAYFSSSLSSLNKREAVLTGSAIKSSCIIHVDEAVPLPNSNDVDTYSEWQKEWKDIDFNRITQQVQN